MTNAELDRKSAEAMGWLIATRHRGRRTWQEWLTNDGGIWHVDMWSPTTNRDQAALLESEIERRGMEVEYANAIANAARLAGYDPDYATFLFWQITAPPSARVAAAVQCLTGEGSE